MSNFAQHFTCMAETYRTLEGPCTGEFRDRGSKFLAYAFPVTLESEWQAHLEAVRKEHPKARHHCYAYRIGLGGINFRANDDGEPGGTAGRPILGQIDSFGLTNTFIVVVRYFGGTLLGTSGLIHAYKTAAADALQKGTILEKLVEDHFLLEFHYALMNDVMHAVKKVELRILRQEFTDAAKLVVAIPRADVSDVFLHLKALIAHIHLEEAALLEEINGLTITKLEVSGV